MVKYILILPLFVIILFSSCEVQQNTGADIGILKGKISIGPLCPVEKIPPDPGCLPTAETYKAWQTAVWTINHKNKIINILPDLNGEYRVEIPQGNYLIDFAGTGISGIGSNNLPALIQISVHDTTIFNINIDTGIR